MERKNPSSVKGGSFICVDQPDRNSRCVSRVSFTMLIGWVAGECGVCGAIARDTRHEALPWRPGQNARAKFQFQLSNLLIKPHSTYSLALVPSFPGIDQM
jgi:hypothetical protein